MAQAELTDHVWNVTFLSVYHWTWVERTGFDAAHLRHVAGLSVVSTGDADRVCADAGSQSLGARHVAWC